MLQRQVSVHEVRGKLGHVRGDVVRYLHVHDIKVVVQPPFKNKGLTLIVDLAGLAEETYFSAAPRKMGDGKEVPV
jgi:hypothetical protein